MWQLFCVAFYSIIAIQRVCLDSCYSYMYSLFLYLGNFSFFLFLATLTRPQKQAKSERTARVQRLWLRVTGGEICYYVAS